MQLYRPARTQQGRRSAVGNWAPDVYGRGLGKTRTRLIGDVKFKDSLSSNVEDIGRRSAFVGFGNTAPDTRADVFGLAQRGVKRTVAAGGSGNFLPGTGAGYDCRDHRHALDSQRVVIVQLARRDPALARGVVHQLVARPATFLQPRMRTSSFSSVVAKADLVLRSKRYGKHKTSTDLAGPGGTGVDGRLRSIRFYCLLLVEETTQHVHHTCPKARAVWELVGSLLHAFPSLYIWSPQGASAVASAPRVDASGVRGAGTVGETERVFMQRELLCSRVSSRRRQDPFSLTHTHRGSDCHDKATLSHAPHLDSPL